MDSIHKIPPWNLNMNILMVSKSDKSGGGAGAIAQALRMHYKNLDGVTVYHSFLYGDFSDSISIPLHNRSWRLARIIRKIEALWGFVDLLPIEFYKLYKLIRKHKVDVVHFHDLSSAISPLTVFLVARIRPVVWTLHDMSPLTGGCIYSGDCKRFLVSCGKCPNLGVWPLVTKVDRTSLLRAVKTVVFKSKKLAVVTPSKWLANLFFDTFNRRVTRVIHNGVEISEKLVVSEKILPLIPPSGSPNILLYASDFGDLRKGFHAAVNILQNLYNSEVKFSLTIIGKISRTLLDKLPPVPIYVAGYLSDIDARQQLISKSDCFLFTSLEDNQPLTVLECLSLSVPVVGFDTGGVGELNDTNSLLITVEKQNIVFATQKLREFLSTTYQRQDSLTVASRSFTIEKMCREYLDLYEELVS